MVSPIAICTNKQEPPEARAEHLEHWVALVDLLLKKDGGWRKGFNVDHVGFTMGAADKRLLKQFVEEIQSDFLEDALCAVQALPPARYPDDQWIVAKALFHVLSRALVELKLLFASRSECDYVELALTAREALLPGDGSADLALCAGGQLRHLLVDEMQDTSAAQYELIKLLTSSWDGHSQTLFLVGDPKQSIYLFRQARVERFLRTVREHRLGDIELAPLRLTANFRSQAALVAGFNQIFGGGSTQGVNPGSRGVFPAPGDEELRRGDAVDVPFVPATAVRPETLPDAIVWHTAVQGEETYDPDLKLTGADVDDHLAQEALQIRRIISERLATPLPVARQDPQHPRPWRIAVLGRARHHLAAVVQELKAHDGRPAIPFRAVDLDPLDELPEVLDALALTRALLHPADRIAWLAILRAPWCGLGLADLLTLTGEGSAPQTEDEATHSSETGSSLFNPAGDAGEQNAEKRDEGEATEVGRSDSAALPYATALPHATVGELVRLRRHRLSPLGQRLLERAWPVLATAAESRGSNPLSVQVERTWRSLGGDVFLLPQQRDNVERFLGVLRELEQDSSLAGRDVLTVLQRRLKTLYAEPEPAPAGQAQIELMTIHKAKGLEWDVVILPGLHRRPRAYQSVLLNWLELDGGTGASTKNPAFSSEGQACSQESAAALSNEASIVLAPIWEKGQDTDKLNRWLNQVRARRERAEEKRLFYVATTRAREQLHLFAALERSKGPGLTRPANGSLLQACWPAAQPHFEALTLPFTARTEILADDRGIAPAPTEAAAEEAAEPVRQQFSLFAENTRVAFPEADAAAALLHSQGNSPSLPLVQRLPLSFDPAARLRQAAAHRLNYLPASALAQRPAFERPEGSAAVRAFGNVVHRYLQVLAARLAHNSPDLPPETLLAGLLAELPGWEPRLNVSLRGEGLPPAVAAREAGRALSALQRTLADPVGRWILAPHPSAASERPLTLASQGSGSQARDLRAPVPRSSFRVDRTFVAGAAPLSLGEDCIWIIDFKTTEQGSRSEPSFAAIERAKYTAQLEAYAGACRSMPGGDRPIHLGLFYPLLTRLLHWEAFSLPEADSLPVVSSYRDTGQTLPGE